MASEEEPAHLPFAPVVGRRRTRAAAQIEIQERREQFKRRAAARAGSENSHTRANSQALGSPRAARVVVGASLSDARQVVAEHTPTKAALQSPPQVRRHKPAPQAVVPTPEKTVPASAGVEQVDEHGSPVAATGVRAAATPPGADATSPTDTEAPVMRPKRVAARGIAQSSSSFSTRKRMISFSPERDERPENRALALLKLQKNLKATEKLQQRLDGVDVRARNEEPRSAFTTPSKDPAAARAAALRSTQPSPFTNPLRTPVKRTADSTPVRLDTPSAPTNQTLEQVSDDDDDDDDIGAVNVSAGDRVGPVALALFTPVKAAPSPARAAFASDSAAASDAFDPAHETTNEQQVRISSQDAGVDSDQVAEAAPLRQLELEAGDDVDCCPTQNLYSQFSEAESAPPLSCSQEPSSAAHEHAAAVVDFSLASSTEFTSTSVIEDVGLFNCDADVEYTGGVYGEGTDGKVSAAVIGGQKVALKRAKPHDGFPEEEAKRRSAVELHYLRKVRHMQGFVQCLGLCDGIDHTCIALEVMDCKLSDYLRRYGRSSGAGSSNGSSSSNGSGASKRRYTLSLDEAKGLLRQIVLPMMLLHDQVNVAHGDLACRNILLRTPPKGYEKRWEPVVKLSDFGRIKLPSAEPKILDPGFSFFKNCDVGAFGREVLYRFLVGEIVPPACLETRSLHKQLQDLVVTAVPDDAKARLGPYYRLFARCTAWGVRPTFREIYEHLDDLEYFELTENGLFPLKPSSGAVPPAMLDASFLSPDGGRAKFVSSGSKGKFETPNGSHRTSAGVPRLLQSKSTEGGAAAAATTTAAAAANSKTVNLLKARSVLRNTPHQVLGAGGAASEKGNHHPPRSFAPPSGFTPNGRPMLLKKTPPSAGASRRSLQILSQIQHRTGVDAGPSAK
ncbi:hypothetical protein PybrP1_008599 [[Pythium] brassicae (nom. inval.)]|nr:hypothetical protein PybrP1_008599 [[Pythium] brassicae (nom. inval.)]